MPNRQFIRLTPPARPGALIGAGMLMLIFLIGVPSLVVGQEERELPDPIVDESFSIRLDEELFQLEEAIALVAISLNKVANRTPSLAINSLHFGKGVDLDFRRKAEVIILDKLFQANPRVHLVECKVCQKLETRIVNGVLKLRKGIPSQEARKELAEKLNVTGFIDIGMFQNEGQLTVYIKVIEAKSGAIILVDELVGRKATKRRAFTISFGEMTFPISLSGPSVDHNALILSFQDTIKLTGRFSFSADLIFFIDNNTNDSSTTVTLDSGLILAPTLGYDIIQVSSSTSRLVMFMGVSKLLSPQLSYASIFRTGLDLVVGDRLSVLFSYNSFLEEEIESPTSGVTATLDGGGYELRFGYRF